MKYRSKYIAVLILIVVGLIGYIAYDKLSFTEKMARAHAEKFFNILMSKSNDQFKEIYPSLSEGNRIVPGKVCTINSVTKRQDGNYDVLAVYEVSKFINHPISIVVNRKGKVISSHGISYAYFDKTYNYGKKTGCITGDEDDVELEKIINEKGLRDRLTSLANLEIRTLNDQLKITSNLTSSYGLTTGNVIITNESPYNFSYGDIKCTVYFYSSDGTITDSENLLISNLNAQSSISEHVFSSSSSSRKYNIECKVVESVQLLNTIKENIILTSPPSCL